MDERNLPPELCNERFYRERQRADEFVAGLVFGACGALEVLYIGGYARVKVQRGEVLGLTYERLGEWRLESGRASADSECGDC